MVPITSTFRAPRNARRSRAARRAVARRIDADPLVHLDKRDELAEDLGDVPAIDLVDEEGESLVRRAPRPIAKPLQHPWPHLACDGTVLCDRSNALEEVLVRVALMKRHELEAITGLVLVSRQVIVLEAVG